MKSGNMAKRAALSTNKTESEYISRQVLQLRAEYLSDVAPDRKMLYQQAKNAMKNQNNNPKCRGIGELTLLDFWRLLMAGEAVLLKKGSHWQVVAR